MNERSTTVKITVAFRTDEDADVIQALDESENKTDLIRRAIRKLAREGE